MISRILAAIAGTLSAAAFAAHVPLAPRPADPPAAAQEMPSRASITPKSASAPKFRAPALAAATRVALPELVEQKQAVAAPANPNQPLRVAAVRALPKSAPVDTWTPVEGGFVSRAVASADGALGLRVRLDLSGFTSPLEVRAQGNDGRVYAMKIDPAQRREAWTPWTEGPEQAIEVFATATPDAGAVRIGAVLHFNESPFAKVAASCTISTQCSTGDTALDTAMAERKKSVAKMSFVDGNSGFVCTGTLINTERFPQAFFMTASHCINNSAAALTLTTLWFYEALSCNSNVASPASEQLAGGAELVVANPALDSTLLRLNEAPPAAAVYAGWNSAPMQPNAPVFSISHPTGDTSRWASGTFEDNGGRWLSPAIQEFNVVTFSRGFIEGGSSGSGLFTQSGNGALTFRGTLLGHAEAHDGDYSCTNLAGGSLYYSRFDVFEPQIRPYVNAVAPAADDAPNRARDLFNTVFADPNGFDKPLNERTETLQLDNRRIDYVGDIDVYRFRVTQTSYVSAWTEGSQDTIGMILNSRGERVVINDDWQEGAPYNMGITRQLTPGTYYAWVAHFEPTGTGAYDLRLRADAVDVNYTALWFNPAESGWGLNITHQGNILFGTLYTYDASGNPTWYSMSGGVKQPDGSYMGELVSTTGPAFATTPWNPNAVARTVVGSMRLSFTDETHGTLTYNVGTAQVTKSITPFNFSGLPTCGWSASNRSQNSNFQDLWWGGPAESGWGVNLAHQGGIIFATLFTYDAAGRPLWLSMSEGRGTTGAAFTGALYRSTGPAFNAVPFTPITAANLTQVGNMSFSFTDGNTGTMTYTVNGVQVTKSIRRLEFGGIKPSCS
jgi:hypothetical protein